MNLRRYITEYQHRDGSKWMGPDFYAPDLNSAQMAALTYPVQPLVVVGEHVETVQDGDVVQHMTTRRGEIRH